MKVTWKGIRLAKEALHENIQEYNKALIEEISEDINNDIDAMIKLSQDPNKDKDELSTKSESKILQLRAAKNKRCILVYLNNRIDKIENLTWKWTGTWPEHIEKNWDEKDKKYYEQYNQLIDRYSKMISFNEMDWTKDYAPPKDLYIEVRALESISNIITHEGITNVERNHTYSFRRSDIEHYLRRGSFVINE